MRKNTNFLCTWWHGSLRKFTTPKIAAGRGFLDVLTQLYAYYKKGANVCMEEEYSLSLQQKKHLSFHLMFYYDEEVD